MQKHKTLTYAVAVMLGNSLLTVGVMRQVTGSLSKPFQDSSALLRFHEDEKHSTAVNCRSLWFQSARAPMVVVTELLSTLLNIVRASANPGKELKGSEVLGSFTAAAGELQMVSTSELSRIEMLAFFINAYNLFALHLHLLRGTLEKFDMKDLKISFTRDYSYMIAAYNYCLAEIEERLFCRVLRAKHRKVSERSQAPEPRVHFALSLCCNSSPRIRIYQVYPHTHEQY